MDSEDEDIFGEEASNTTKKQKPVISDDENDEGAEEDDGLGLGVSEDELEQDEDEEERNQQTRQIRVLQATIPRFAASHHRAKSSVGKNEDVYYTRVPAFLTLDPHPFDSAQFLDNLESSSSASESQKIRLQNENTIRWKYAKEGNEKVIKESNARFVKWSDGSFSLQVGSELFDVKIDTPYDEHFLCLSHPANELLHTQTLLSKNMSIRPSSTQSETHKRLTAELAKRTIKQSSLVGNVATTDDPEKRQQEAERAQEQLLRARRKLEAKKRQQEERLGLGSGGGGAGAGSYSRMETITVGGRGGGGGGLRHDEYEEDDFVVEDEEEEEEGMGEEEEEEEEEVENGIEEEEEEGEEIDEAEERRRAERLERAKRGPSNETPEPRKKVRRIISDDEE